MTFVITIERTCRGMERTAFLFLCAVLMAAAASARSGEETLSDGIAAYRSGRIDTALRLLEQEQANPYLEAFRLFYRAESFSRDSMHRDAAADLERLLALPERKAIVERHPLVERARNGYIEAVLKSGSCFALKEIPFDIESLSAHSLLILSKTCFERGMNRDAIAFLVAAARGKPLPADSTLYRELALKCEALCGGIPRGERISIAKGASALRLFREAAFFIDSLIEEDTDDYPVLLCKGALLSRAGEPRRALQQFWRIFYSRAPIEAKKEALREISAIEYRMKKYDKACEHYLMFGLYYPRDSRAVSSLDAAARIAVLRGEWERALGIWAIVRKRCGNDPVSSEAALSEGALRYWRGEKVEAYRIFEALLPRVNGTIAPSVLYWLARSSSSEAQKLAWSDSLARGYPRSCYATLLKQGEEFLLGRGSRMSASDISVIERWEKGIRDSIALEAAPNDSLSLNPAYRAYIYFLDHDLREEARETAYALIDALGPDDRSLFEIYRRAVTNGLLDLSFFVLNRMSARERTVAIPWELWYPSAHLSMIEAHAAARELPADLILAVIREESKFDPAAVSVAGARGLMQLLPSTAAWLAGPSDSAHFSSDDLFDQSVNITMGIEYLDYLMRRFNGSIVGALAAYNAGEGRMVSWKENSDPAAQPMIALEMIGPRETRLYVKRVLDALSAYRTIEQKARLR